MSLLPMVSIWIQKTTMKVSSKKVYDPNKLLINPMFNNCYQQLQPLLTIPPLSSLVGSQPQQESYKSNTPHPKSASTVWATAPKPTATPLASSTALLVATSDLCHSKRASHTTRPKFFKPLLCSLHARFLFKFLWEYWYTVCCDPQMLSF